MEARQSLSETDPEDILSPWPSFSDSFGAFWHDIVHTSCLVSSLVITFSFCFVLHTYMVCACHDIVSFVSFLHLTQSWVWLAEATVKKWWALIYSGAIIMTDEMLGEHASCFPYSFSLPWRYSVERSLQCNKQWGSRPLHAKFHVAFTRRSFLVRPLSFNEEGIPNAMPAGYLQQLLANSPRPCTAKPDQWKHLEWMIIWYL